MTQLEKFQKAIDTCNHKNGCDSKCCKDQQEKCEKLKAHRDRMDYCRENNMPIELW